MPIEKVLSAIAAVLIPAMGLALQGSRRNRLIRRIEGYLELAEKVRPRDSAAADKLTDLAAAAVGTLVDNDRRTMRRKLDSSALVALLFLTLPAAGVFVWALGWSTWKWPALVISAVWVVVWGAVGLSQLWREKDDEHESA